jgi:hypothetical protein
MRLVLLLSRRRKYVVIHLPDYTLLCLIGQLSSHVGYKVSRSYKEFSKSRESPLKSAKPGSSVSHRSSPHSQEVPRVTTQVRTARKFRESPLKCVQPESFVCHHSSTHSQEVPCVTAQVRTARKFCVSPLKSAQPGSSVCHRSSVHSPHVHAANKRQNLAWAGL